MSIVNLKKIASVFRCALEGIPIKDRSKRLENFPCGSCMDVTLLLGTFLIEYENLKFDYMVGVCVDLTDHAWLERDGIIVDISADQFPDCSETILVSHTDCSAFHHDLDGEKRGVANFWEFNPTTISELAPIYKKICRKLGKQAE